MNLDQAKKYILLQQSGELSARKRRQLDRFLQRSPEGQRYLEELKEITHVARSTSTLPLSEFTLAPILDEARRVQTDAAVDRSRSGESMVTWSWKSALATAALALLLASSVLVFVRAPRNVAVTQDTARDPTADLAWEDDFNRQLEDLDSLLVSASSHDDWYDYDLDALARELLDLEGSQI